MSVSFTSSTARAVSLRSAAKLHLRLALAAVTAAAVAALCTVSAGAASLGTFGPYSVQPTRAIMYGSNSADNMLVCRPQTNSRATWNGPFPAILLVHGGAWDGGTNAVGPAYTGYSGTWCQMWASWGFVAFSVDYRLMPRYPWPQQLVDVQAAVRYVRANAKYLDVNPGAIGIEGDSAGGSLAEQVGWSTENVHGDISGSNAGASPKTQFVISQFGPYNWGPNNGAGLLPSTYAARAVAYNSHVLTADTLFIQGKYDTTVKPAQSTDAYCMLKTHGRPASYLSYPGGHEYTGMSGPGWAGTVGNLQTEAVSWAYSHNHADGVIPSWVGGPGRSFNDATLPRC